MKKRYHESEHHSRESGLVSEREGAQALLPTEIIMKDMAREGRANHKGLPDLYSGVDAQMNNLHAEFNRLVTPKKI